MKKGLSIVLAASVIVALAAGLVGYAPAQAEDAQWTASYWNNTKLKGKAVVTRQEDAISYNWGTASPIPHKVKKDGFSIRWKRSVNFAEGPYVFTAGADDGVRVWIDNQKIIDQWNVQYYTTFSVLVNLSAGEHAIRVDYYENDGDAAATFTWSEMADGPWTAQYFNGTKLSGTALVTRSEGDVNYDWGTLSPAPGIRVNNFSARWTRSLPFNTDKYKFKVTASGGFRLYLDEKLIMDEWYTHKEKASILKLKVRSGDHNIRLDYFNRSRSARLVLKIKPWK